MSRCRHGWIAVVLVVGCGTSPIAGDAGSRIDAGSGADAGATVDCLGEPDGTPCGQARVCIRNVCEPSECGDGVTDARTEDCDDGNDVMRDGCEFRCTFTCTTDPECPDDGDACNGEPSCNPATHACDPGTNAADGTACPDGICLGGACVASSCGDGFVDPSTEECEDGNPVDGDGCDSDCQRSCDLDRPCPDDGDSCNGDPSCDATTNTCANTPPPAEGTACIAGGAAGTCRSEACVPAGCGNGIVDAGEDCDDGPGDASDADGCTRGCRWTCDEDADCSDSDACTGVETCLLASHTCMPGTALACDDGNSCTADSCIPALGCMSALIDGDGDGEAAPGLGSCGTDCDDGRASVCSGCSELCMDGLDNDCNGTVDDGLTTWYADCDGDGYAPAGGATVMSCALPAASTTGCSGSARQWVARSPTGTNIDCNDGIASVHPGATETVGNGRDDDCSGREICYQNSDGDSHRTSSTTTSADGDCSDSGEALSSRSCCDCNDTNAAIYPGRTEICDGINQDCDSATDEGLGPPTSGDAEEDNSQWFSGNTNQPGGPTLPGGTTGSSSVVSPPGTLTFHAGDAVDHYTWDQSYPTWNPGFRPRWMCRVTGLTSGQRVQLRVGAFRPAGGGAWIPGGCGSPGDMSCFSHTGTCASVGDGGTCATSFISDPTAGASLYGFGVQVSPVGSGWSGCDTDYDVECKLTTSATW